MTNFEKIKKMSSEDVASAIINMGCTKCERITGKCKSDDDKGCEETVREWLESECEEDGKDEN